MYQYRYGPNFYNWLPVFLEKAQTAGTNQNFIIRRKYFSSFFLFPCDILVIRLCPTYQVMV